MHALCAVRLFGYGTRSVPTTLDVAYAVRQCIAGKRTDSGTALRLFRPTHYGTRSVPTTLNTHAVNSHASTL